MATKKENLLKKVIATYKEAKSCISVIGSPFDMTEYNLEEAEYTVNDEEIIVCKRIGEEQDAKIIYNCSSGEYAEIITYRKEGITNFEKAIKETVEGRDYSISEETKKELFKSEPFKHLPNIDWQIEEPIEKSEGIYRIIGYDHKMAKYEGSALVIGGLIEKVEDYEKVSDPAKRPNLSFITSKKFNSSAEYCKWISNLSDEEIKIVKALINKLPQLITCTEMLYDSNFDKPEGFVFGIAKETLNLE